MFLFFIVNALGNLCLFPYFLSFTFFFQQKIKDLTIDLFVSKKKCFLFKIPKGRESKASKSPKDGREKPFKKVNFPCVFVLSY